jgi:hypothetical protein
MTVSKGYGVKRHFQQYFSYIVVVGYSGRHRGTRRKPLTCRKSLTNLITYYKLMQNRKI